jgi:hypothetical protein
MLEANPYVARYAWFALPPYQTLGLANSDGSLTSVGTAYAASYGGHKSTHDALHPCVCTI